MFERIQSSGFQVEFHAHAEGILTHDFPEVETELEDVLLQFRVQRSELLKVGGGESAPTQRLRNLLNHAEWKKHCFKITRSVDDVEKESATHEIDHVRKFDLGTIALEIEWNTKDTFFDRDLENFKRLHIDAAISVGFIITRGSTFQDSLKDLVRSFVTDNGITSMDDLRAFKVDRTTRQTGQIEAQMSRGTPFIEAFTSTFVSDKYGQATTHWRKLKEKIRRGAGGSCPLALIGLPKDIIDIDGPRL